MAERSEWRQCIASGKRLDTRDGRLDGPSRATAINSPKDLHGADEFNPRVAGWNDNHGLLLVLARRSIRLAHQEVHSVARVPSACTQQ